MWMEAIMASLKYYDVMTEKPARIASALPEIQTEHLPDRILDQTIWL
jgi:hypothetical protein